MNDTMKVRVPMLPGEVLDARLTTTPSMISRDRMDVVLEVNAGAPMLLHPPSASGCIVVRATEKELSELKAYGFNLAHQPETKLEDDALVRMLVPVGRSGWAIAAGYAGLFALVIVPAPLALILGAVAIWHLEKNPEKRGLPRAVFGLITGLVGTGVLIAMAVN